MGDVVGQDKFHNRYIEQLRSAKAEAQQYRTVATCPLCDDEGYHGTAVCDHIDRAEVSRLGVELCRRAMAEAKATKRSGEDRRG